MLGTLGDSYAHGSAWTLPNSGNGVGHTGPLYAVSHPGFTKCKPVSPQQAHPGIAVMAADWSVVHVRTGVRSGSGPGGSSVAGVTAGGQLGSAHHSRRGRAELGSHCEGARARGLHRHVWLPLRRHLRGPRCALFHPCIMPTLFISRPYMLSHALPNIFMKLLAWVHAPQPLCCCTKLPALPKWFMRPLWILIVASEIAASEAVPLRHPGMHQGASCCCVS